MEKHGGAIGRENHRYLPDAHRARAAASNRARALVRAGKGEARRDTDCGQNSPRSGPEIKAHSLRHIQHRPDESKAYCTRKMVLTMGSTLINQAGAVIGSDYLNGQKTPVGIVGLFLGSNGVLPTPDQTYHDFWQLIASGAQGI